MEGVSDSALRVSIDTLLEGVQVIGYDWTYVYLNAAACQHGRRSREELLGRTMMECYPGIEQTEMFACLERVMRTRRSDRLATQFVYPDGHRAWFELNVEAVPDGICVLSVDISEQRRMQAQFQQAQKMEAVGQLAGGIAHDFNNVLTAILGYCELLLERVKDEPDVVGDVAEIHTAATRAGRLTRQLLAFSKKQFLQPEVLNLTRVVTDLEKMLSRLIRDDIRVVISAAPSLPNVKADRGQIEQVLVNLVINARDAMPQAGTIEISTAEVTLDDDFVRSHDGSAPGRFVTVAVRDTGTGMTPEILRHVFEPFFTTKGPGKGTGLGLATVYGIVRQSGGYIWIDTAFGTGTTITTYWPVVDEPLADAPPASAQKSSRGSETILLADDDPALRLLIRRVLQRAGYTVLEAQDVTDALQFAEKHPRPIDLFLSDIIMPEMNGPNLAQLLLNHQPMMKVLYISGFPYSIVPGSQSSSHRVGFLAKPFEPRVLVDTVRSFLDRQ